jgi:hypothetical protein
MSKLFLVLICAFLLGGCTSSGGDYYGGRYDEDVERYDDPPITSDNWECTDDCSGHEAGYDWASDQGISDPDDCGGKSDSFIEGCEAYANEKIMESEDDYADYESDRDYLY